MSIISYRTSSLNNITVVQQLRGVLEKVLFSVPMTLSCCVFLFINGIMLFTLRSKVVFRQTSRYVLLFNLLCADTIQMALSQLLYLLASVGITLTYPVCGVIIMLANLTNEISPLTLVVMSLERYVVVCYPLRQFAITTIRNTAVAIALIWAFSSLNIITQVVLLLEFPFEDIESLQMKGICVSERIQLGPMSEDFEKGFTYFVFVLACVVVVSSYTGVMRAARSASVDKVSAQKARNTLLLHMVQLGLSLSSTIHNQLILALSKIRNRLLFARIRIVLYVCVILFPRCLSALIYGIRDQTIRSKLMCHLCCCHKSAQLRSHARRH